MNQLPDEQKARIKAGLDLLCEETTTLEKIQKISTLLRGFNSKIDKHLVNISEVAEKIQQVQSGDVIGLTTEKLPEKTEEQKKRKKLTLLLWNNWNDLKSEVERFSNLQTSCNSGQGNPTGIARILSTMKGPLGLITIAAAGIVAVASFTSNKIVTVNIKNDGCQPIGPFTETPVNLPAIKIPNNAISNGKQEVFVVPGLDVTVNATLGNDISITAFGYSGDFQLSTQTKDIVYDGKSLMGKVTEVKLSSAKTHEIIVKCNP